MVLKCTKMLLALAHTFVFLPEIAHFLCDFHPTMKLRASCRGDTNLQQLNTQQLNHAPYNRNMGHLIGVQAFKILRRQRKLSLFFL